jgi:hypothetical protein
VTGGLCEGRDEWTATDRTTLREAAAVCLGCPALDPCAQWAARHRWQGVAVAGRWFPLREGLPYEKGRTP